MHNGFVYQLSWQERKRRQRKWLFAGGGVSLCLVAITVLYWPQSSQIPQASVIKEIEPKVVKTVHKPKTLPRSRSEERFQKANLQIEQSSTDTQKSTPNNKEIETTQSPQDTVTLEEVKENNVIDVENNEQNRAESITTAREETEIQVVKSDGEKPNFVGENSLTADTEEESDDKHAKKVNPVPHKQTDKGAQTVLVDKKSTGTKKAIDTQNDDVKMKGNNTESTFQTAQPLKLSNDELTKEDELTQLIKKVNPVPEQQKSKTPEADKRIRTARTNVRTRDEILVDDLENANTQSKITLPVRRPSFRSDFKSKVKHKPTRQQKTKRRYKKRKKRYYSSYDRYNDYRDWRYERDPYEYRYRRKHRGPRYNHNYDYYSEDYYRNYRKYRRRFRQRYGY